MGCGISTLEILGNTAIEVGMEKKCQFKRHGLLLLLGGCFDCRSTLLAYLSCLHPTHELMNSGFARSTSF